MPQLAPDELFDSPPTVGPASPPEAPARAPSEPEPREQVRRADGKFGHQHPAYLLEQARDYGVAEEDVAEFTSDQLGRAVNIARRLEQRRIQQEATRQTLEHRPPQPASAPPPVPGDVEEEYEGMDEVHEPIRKAFKDVRKQNQELRKRLEEQDGFIRQQRAQQDLSAENRLDDAFAELSDYTDRVGDGPARSVKPAQFKVRGFLLQLAGIDTTKPLPSDKHLNRALKKAAESLFGEAAPAEARASDAGVYARAPTAKDWQRGQVQRPSGRKGAPEPDGESKAVNNLTQKMRELGALPGQSRNEILDGLPD